MKLELRRTLTFKLLPEQVEPPEKFSEIFAAVLFQRRSEVALCELRGIFADLPERTDYFEVNHGHRAEQSYCGVAVDDSGEVVGLYILHPNNVGRCGHICNASYAVSSKCRGRHIGEKLVLDCIAQAKDIGFMILQFNAVVESNIHARHLYERIGFKQLGVIPNGFRMKDGHFENICPYYIEL